MPISVYGDTVINSSDHPGYVSGIYYIAQNNFVSDTTSQTAWAVNSITYTPIPIFEDVHISRVALYCPTAKTGADATFGLYTNENGRPKKLLFTSTSASFQTTGFKEVITNLYLKKGRYWLGGITYVPPYLSTITSFMGSNAIIGQLTPSVTIANCSIRNTKATSYLSLPETAPLDNVSLISGSLAPIVWIKIA